MKYIVTFILLSIILLLLYEIEYTKTDDSEKFHKKLSNIFIDGGIRGCLTGITSGTFMLEDICFNVVINPLMHLSSKTLGFSE